MAAVNRSQPSTLHYLYVPADQSELLNAAATSAAGGLLVDLEDGVPAANKAKARANARRFLESGAQGQRDVLLRINDLSGSEWRRDLDELAAVVSTFLVPKVSSPDEVHAVDTELQRLERNQSQSEDSRHRLALLIETAAGAARIREIVSATDRARVIVFGQADFTVDVGCEGIVEDGFQPSTLMDVAHAQIVLTAAAAGLRAVVAPWARRDDQGAQLKEMRRLFAFGYHAMIVSTDSMVANVVAAYRPTRGQIEFAEGVLEAQRAALAKGMGATSYRGWLIEGSYVTMAQALLARQNAGVVEDR